MATSPNERLQRLFHPWTSYVIVPLFALANAGIAIDGGMLARAFRSPITLGILTAYVVGKPLGVFSSTWLAARLSKGRLIPPVGWAAVAGGGTIAGIGFTVSLLVATLAFDGPQLEAGVPALWIPKIIKRVDKIPMLGTGKTDLKAVRELALKKD